jgi:hypothetical protein
MKPALLLISLFSISFPMGAVTVLIDDDFSAGQGDWAIRKQQLAGVEFEDSAVKLMPRNQPAAVYRTFNDIALLDGEAFRFTVVASVEDIEARTRALRIGFGYSSPPLRGESDALRIPMNGYWFSFPTLGDLTPVRVAHSGFVPPDEDINFFNTVIANLGNIPVSGSVGNDPVLLSVEVARSGDDFVFSASMDGVELTEVVIASADNVIEEFRFNTVGMAFQFTADGSATYESARLEFLSDRLIPPGLDSVFGLLTQVDEGRYATRAFGVIQPSLEPWIWHEDLGWLHAMPNSHGNWVGSLDFGWLYLTPGWLPWVWSQDHGWMYYQPGGGLVAVQQG